ncbi:MAG: Rieske 2Fe-2S domain-containing protein [Verrucomicrobia bacterium]|nr:Rieske 2Fe-2S domain-containing protein [Verrucomicrobiota bacterium]
MPRQQLAKMDALTPGQTIKFDYTQNGVPREGFLVRLKESWVAYENRCRHIAISLDFGDGQFFTEDGKYLFCQTHGAVYEPDTGLCVHGPCTGAKLFSIPLEIDNSGVWIDME